MEQPIGPKVHLGPQQTPRGVQLHGHYVSVCPLHPNDENSLYDSIGKPERDNLWTYVPSGPFKSRKEFTNHLVSREVLLSDDPKFFAVVPKKSGWAEGYIALMRIDEKNRVVEIGHVIFGPGLQRTREATEVFYLLLKYVFETLGYRRVEWKCNDLNAPSKRAALRLGFQYEGLFRQHWVVKGRNRDTAWYSMIDREWPKFKMGFEGWLGEGNFDEKGRQERRLEDFRAGAGIKNGGAQ